MKKSRADYISCKCRGVAVQPIAIKINTFRDVGDKSTVQNFLLSGSTVFDLRGGQFSGLPLERRIALPHWLTLVRGYGVQLLCCREFERRLFG